MAEAASEAAKNHGDYIFVKNVPERIEAPDVCGFFNGALLAAGGTIPGALDGCTETNLPVVHCRTATSTPDSTGGREAGHLIRLRNPILAMLCIRLNGITLQGSKLGIVSGASAVDLSQVDEPGTDSAGGLIPAPEADRLYIQDLPIDMDDQQLKDLLEQFGELRSLQIVRDSQTGLSKGFGFLEYKEYDVTDFALQALNGFMCGRNIIKCQRCPGQGISQIPLGLSNFRPSVTLLPTSMTRRALENPVIETQVMYSRQYGATPSQIVQLLNVALAEDLFEDKDHEAIMKEVRIEATKFGPLLELVIPRPDPETLAYQPGVGKIFLYYEDLTAARKAQLMFNGRIYDSRRVVCAAFYPMQNFLQKQYVLAW